jgi:DNA-directed RNA polymerase II subunit RPB2
MDETSQEGSIQDEPNQEPREQIDKKMDKLAWKILDIYFNDNPNNLVSHHLESYNDFFHNGLLRIIKENNPIKFKAGGDKKAMCDLYVGGKEGKLVYFGKPVIYDAQRKHTHFMYPNDARLRSMTYGMTIHYDVEVTMKYNTVEGEDEVEITEPFLIPKILLGTFPIMLQSNFCILDGMNRDVRFYMGECRNDYGGYFIIEGKEKVIVCQEKFANNQISVKNNKTGSEIWKKYLCSASVKSVSDDKSKPKRTTRVMIVTGVSQRMGVKPKTDKVTTMEKEANMDSSSKLFTNNQIVVDVPNVSVPVPLFILMRALGVISDKEIIETCLLDIEKESSYVDLFIPSVHDAAEVFTQNVALEYIASFTKQDTIPAVLKILADMFLPHIGDVNFLDKAYYLGHMVFRMLKVYTKQEPDTNIDEYNYKRIETSGALIDDLFSEYYLIQKKLITLKIDRKYNSEPQKYEGVLFPDLLKENTNEIFEERIVEEGFKKAFKGKWGSEKHTRRDGIVQDLNRLSWNSFMTHLRKITLQIDKTSKVVGPRKLNNSQWGLIDPFDTPDGAGVGLDKHFTILARVTTGLPSSVVIGWLRANTLMKDILHCNNPQYIYTTTKIFVNGNWFGVIDNPIVLLDKFKLHRRLGVLPFDISISFNYKNEININTDAGRLIRPVYYFVKSDKENNLAVLNDIPYRMLEENEKEKEKEKEKEITWNQIITGFLSDDEKKAITSVADADAEKYKKDQCLLEYIDTEEEQCALIATNMYDDFHGLKGILKRKFYTHMEIDGSLILSVMGNLVSYPEHNPIPRNSFSCGQSKQAVSVFNTNYQLRMDKMAVVLNYGQIPLIKSRFLHYINREEMPYGVNAIVAIMSYTGYNVEDAILINEGAVQRGLFRTTYLTTYEGREESSSIQKKNEEVPIDSVFKNVENNVNTIGKINEDYDYSKLDVNGFIGENIEIDEKTVLIGKLTTDPEDTTKWVDTSIHTKKGQTGYTDKVYVSEGEDGFRIAKVRVREDRSPSIGDKMASRCGQKGTIGLIIPEKDMPFTADGVRPDIIINPHALPSRMTIGQLIECIFGKVCTSYGFFGEGTAFKVEGSNYSTYGEMLVNQGFHSSGNQLLHDGITGEQLEANIFIGPTYYMRLKHMVKDKINHRDEGPNTSLTRQPVQGRANDGGLRIGEMERDGVLAHGMSKFLNESFMERAGDDRFELAVCNKTGAVAIFNRQRNLFFSPMSDGPIKFNIDTKKPDEDFKVENVSRFGRSFSVVLVPYTFKLLLQELQAMNIQMRIITDDNVDQLMSMCYSDNIKKLLKNKDDKPLEDVMRDYTREMKIKTRATPPAEKKKKEKSWKDKIIEDSDITINNLAEAHEIVRECFNHIWEVEQDEFLKGGIQPLPPNVNCPLWYADEEVAVNTMTYIFNEVICNCYLLCVLTINRKKYNRIVKLEPYGIPTFFQTLLQANPDVLEILGKNYFEIRLMNCRLSKRRNETFSVEYKEWFNQLQNLQNGIYVLNLTDQVIIRKDGRLPWGEQFQYQKELKYLPVFSLSGAKDFYDIPMPNYDDIVLFLSHKPGKKQQEPNPLIVGLLTSPGREVVPWNDKQNKAVFRGGPTGCGLFPDTNARLNIAEMGSKPDLEEFLDAGVVALSGPVRYDAKKNVVSGLIVSGANQKEKMDYEQQAKFKYIIHIDGNVAAYRLASTMLLGSVILKVEGEYTLWYEHLLVKWDWTMDERRFDEQPYNCISVQSDLSNLIGTIEMCRQRDEICKRIAENGVGLARMILDKDFIDISFKNMLLAANKTAQDNLTKEFDKAMGASWNVPAFVPRSPDNPPPSFFPKTPPGTPPPRKLIPTTFTTPEELLQGQTFGTTSPAGIRQDFVPKSPDNPPPEILQVIKENEVESGEKDLSGGGEIKTIKL